MARHAPLVCQHVEKLSRAVFERHLHVIRNHIRGRHGLYALYRGDELRYVGLATDLRTRLDQHRRDKHAEDWDRFSIYLTIGDAHLREIEALVIRIANPDRNTQRGRLTASENLLHKLRRSYRSRARDEEADLFGDGRPEKLRGPLVEHASSTAQGVLARYVDGPMRLRARYKGESYHATVRRDGLIRFRGRLFKAPWGAAHAVVRRSVSGWDFWECERARGDWVRLRELKRQRRW